MGWVLCYVLLAVAGLVVLAVLGWRLWRDVRELSRTAAVSLERLRGALAELASATRQDETGPPSNRR